MVDAVEVAAKCGEWVESVNASDLEEFGKAYLRAWLSEQEVVGYKSKTSMLVHYDMVLDLTVPLIIKQEV